MLRRTLAAVCVTLMLMISAAAAQEQNGSAPGGADAPAGQDAPGPGGPGGPGPAGGMGMRFGPGFGFGGAFNNSLMVLGIPAVQKELSMTDDQKTHLTELRQKAFEQMRSAMPDFQKMQDMSQDEWDKFRSESRKKTEDANQQNEEQIAKILDAKQLSRLKQVRLQVQGAMALLSPDVVDKLKISADAQAKMRQIIMDNARNQFPPFGFNQTDEERKAAAEKMQEQRKATMRAVLDVLSDDQLVEWGSMIGDEFALPQGQGFGFGFGGPPPGFRPGGFGPGSGPGGPDADPGPGAGPGDPKGPEQPNK